MFEKAPTVSKCNHSKTDTRGWTLKCKVCSMHCNHRKTKSPPTFLSVREPVQEGLASRQRLVMRELATSGV